MTYRVLEWNYDDVNSIIAKLSNACVELRKTPALSTSDTGSEHDATLSKHVTALNSTLSHMAWILNGIYLPSGRDRGLQVHGRRGGGRHARNPTLQ